MELPEDLKEALKTLKEESVQDFIYEIRENEMQGWDGPRVKAWSKMSEVIDKYTKE